MWSLLRGAQKNPVGVTLFALLAVAALTAGGYWLHLAFAIASPLYLLVIVVQALFGNFAGSALVSLTAVACLDYFFVDPLFSFTVAGRMSAVALVSFLITSLVITRLVTRVRYEARTATQHRDRIDRLYHVAQQLLALEPEAAVGETLVQPFLGECGTRAVCLFDGERGEVHMVGTSRGHLLERTRSAFLQEQDVDDPASQICVRRLRLGGKTTGAMGFEGLEEPDLTAGPLISLAVASQERTRMFQHASEAAAEAQTEVYRSALLDALAQEFKTPLATILAAAGGIRETGALRSEQVEMTETVESEAARLGSLTSRLLKVVRLDREDVHPRMEITDVAAVAEDMVGQYKRLPSDRQISFVRSKDSVMAWADAELLRLALGQLLDNACKYSLPGSTIKVEVASGVGIALLRVSNSGSFIAENEREHIFDRFYRGTEARRFTTGSGLGLYVARKIALAHGGKLDLELDRPRETVTFCLSIPTVEPGSED